MCLGEPETGDEVFAAGELVVHDEEEAGDAYPAYDFHHVEDGHQVDLEGAYYLVYENGGAEQADECSHE